MTGPFRRREAFVKLPDNIPVSRPDHARSLVSLAEKLARIRDNGRIPDQFVPRTCVKCLYQGIFHNIKTADSGAEIIEQASTALAKIQSSFRVVGIRLIL